ncbi:MAG: glycosyltransferase family 4 protein [Candidatus Binatia bacterium]
MRVLHVDPERGWGGGEVQVLGLVRALALRGHAGTLAIDPRGRLAPAAAAAGIATVGLPIASHADVLAGLRLRRLARGMDVVHFHTARAHALAPFCAGLPVWRVVTRRMDYVPRGGPYARLLYNRAVDVVIAISDGVRRALLAGGVRPERIRVVPSGIDVEAFAAPAGARARLRAEWGVPPDALLVLVIGALERRKGHAVLLAAAAEAPARVHYAFCGAGGEAAAIAEAARPLGRRVHVVGFRQDIAACLAAADVVAMPSLQEGLGVAALEAMAAGRPVVASRVGGLAEVVQDGESGLLVPPGDAGALAAALARLERETGLGARLGEAARAAVAARYTTARMAEGTLACYERAP